MTAIGVVSASGLTTASPSASLLARPSAGAADCGGAPTAGGIVPVGLGGVDAVAARLAEAAEAPAFSGASCVTLGFAGTPDALSSAGLPASVLAGDVAVSFFSGAPPADGPGGNAAGRAPAFLTGPAGRPGLGSCLAFLAA